MMSGSSSSSRVTVSGSARCAKLRSTAAIFLLGLAGSLAVAAPAAALPDLVIESVTANPEAGPNGTAVEVTVRVRNQGDSNAPASKTRIRINTDPTTVGGSDTNLCNGLDTPALTPGSAANVTCTPTLRSRPVGPNYIWAIADAPVPESTVNESNEDNNRLSDLFTVNSNAPDLIVQSVTVNPSEVANGTAPTVTVVVKNQGTAAAPSTVTRIRINANASSTGPEDTEICSVATAVIAIGGVAQVQCTETLSGRPAGTNYVWAIADVNDTAGELERGNNRKAAAIEVSEISSDLVVDDIVLNPTGGPNGEPVDITITVRNAGSGPAFASDTRVRINQNPDGVSGTDQSICGPISTAALDPGETTEVTCKPTLQNRPAGTNYIWAILDVSQTAGQGQNERLNDRVRADFEVDPPPAPDMAIRTLSVNPTFAANGSQITITARVANEGELTAPATVTRVVINDDPTGGPAEGDIVLCDINTIQLSPGASLNVSCKPLLNAIPAGQSYLWATADINGVSGQNNHDNDVRSVPFVVQNAPAPDLVVQAVQAQPASGGSGDTITVTATIRNNGNAAAAPSLARMRLNKNTTAVADTDATICEAVTPTLAAGATILVGCNWVIGAQSLGTWQVWATADINNTAGQLQRTNDSARTPFSVVAAAGPDLTVKRLVVRPDSLRNGETLVVRARVVNIGNATALASSTTFRINLNANSVSPADDILCAAKPTQALLPGASVRVRCAVKLAERPVGLNYAWATVDVGDTAGQSNFENDSRSAPVTVLNSSCTPPAVAPELTWPIELPRVLQDYASYGSVSLGGGDLGYHSGLDLISQLSIPPDQTPVYAAADGEVVAVRKSCPSPADEVENPPNGNCAGGLGNYVVIRHGDGVYSLYAHLGEVFAKLGCVLRGDRLGLVGSSGSTSIPPHLHFDVLANLVEPVARKVLGSEHYETAHPYFGSRPETPEGIDARHLDARDFMERDRVRVTVATTASRYLAGGSNTIFLGKDQQYVSYGELVPGYVLIDVPHATLPEDGPPYGDGLRYAWVEASKIEVLAAGLQPGSLRVDGLNLFLAEGVGPNYVVIREDPTETSAEATKAWGDQQLVPAGAAVAEAGSGRLWRPVYIPGTTQNGANGPREGWIPVDKLGSAPAY